MVFAQRSCLVSAVSVGAFCCLCLDGCTTVPPADDVRVASLVECRMDQEVCWNQGCEEDCQVDNAIEQLLEQELTVDSAVQIALLNNPTIQATFEEIGIAQADLVQAGLFQNPIFDGYVRFPDHPSLQLNTAFSITQTFLDLFLIPLRKKIAEVELEQAHLRVANAVLNLAFTVQETFYDLQAEQMKQPLLALLEQAAEAAKELAEAQKQQGNINDLALQSRLTEYLESQIVYTQNQMEQIRLREKMNQLLGLSSNGCWQLTDHLPELPEEEVPIECLESIALSQRLDLEIARREVERTARMLGIKQWWAYTDLAAGISTEHEAEGFQETGPALAGAVPLFNYGQADRARLYALYRQRCEQQKALEITVLSEVRSARDRVAVNRELVLIYQKEIIPLQEQIVSTSQTFYNTMGLSIYHLLDMKKQEIRVKIDSTANLRNYWISQVELSRALGGNQIPDCVEAVE